MTAAPTRMLALLAAPIIAVSLLAGCTPSVDEDRCVAPSSGQGPWVEADDGEACVWDGTAWVEADDGHSSKRKAKPVKSTKKSAKSGRRP